MSALPIIASQQGPNTVPIESQGEATSYEYPFAEANTFYRIRKQ